jgi:adenylate cyclase
MTATAHTFIFADLAGYTALTEAHGDERAADVVSAFCAEARRLAAPRRVEAVKALGDGILVHAVDAGAALRFALALRAQLGARHEFPGMRVGLATGSAAQRDGDWYGSAVNLAARVVDQAEAGDVLLTRATHTAVTDMPQGVVFRSRGLHRLKHVREPVELLLAEASSPPPDGRLVVDPVCHMVVDVARAYARRELRGTVYWLCSVSCAAAFDAASEQYILEARSAETWSAPAGGDGRSSTVEARSRSLRRARTVVNKLLRRSGAA